MDAFKQLHVARRLMPFLPMFFHALRTLNIKSAEDFVGNIDALFLPFTETIAGMKDDDVNYIAFNCLRVTTRKVEGSDIYSNVIHIDEMNINNSRLMYEDMAMDDLLQISWRVIQKDLMRFFPGLPAKNTVTNLPEA